jgi:hypothetical protein
MLKYNYFFRENETDLQYFCQLQVSRKFNQSMNTLEQTLCEWIVDNLVHRSVTNSQMVTVVESLRSMVDAINATLDDTERRLEVEYMPLLVDASGYILVRRSGRRQQLLLPIIDCRGAVNIR